MTKPPRSKSTAPTGASAAPPEAAALDPAIAQLGYEEAIDELESIIERMEQGETGLEESLREYARGDALIRRCRQVLDDAEQRIEAISGKDLEAGAAPTAIDPPF